jgi:exopolysaccharide biosynthesis polyprenyl glycosylphosphotransferase
MNQRVKPPRNLEPSNITTADSDDMAILLSQGYSPHVLDITSDTTAKIRHKKTSRARLAIGLAVHDVLAIAAAFTIASFFRLGLMSNAQLYDLLMVSIPIYLGIAFNMRAYGINALGSFWTSYSRSAAALIFTLSAMLLTMFFLKASAEYSRVIFGLGTVISLAMLFAGRWIMSTLSKKLLGDNPMAEIRIADGVTLHHSADAPVIDADAMQLVPDLSAPIVIQRLGILTHNMDRVIVHCTLDKRQSWAAVLKTLDIYAEIITPELKELAPIAVNRRDGQIALMVSQGPLKWNERLSKRIFDIVFALIAIPVLALPMLIVAIAIKIESRGPILFTQKRIGLGNRPFNILKFRSMRAEQSDASGTRSTGRDDDRITRIGAFIRKTSIDELPQLFNVLVGSMSVVGPRPHAIGSRAENMLFWDIDERYWHRHAIKPGLTGLAQILGFRGATEKRADLEDRLQADLDYRADWSLWNDIKIILLTFRVLVHRNAF